MIYKTHKDVYETVSGRLNLDYEIIRSIGDFYWGDVARRFESLENREMYLSKLGIFRFRKLASVKYIQNSAKSEMLLRSLGRSEEIISEALRKIKERTDRMEILIKEWQDITEQQKKYKEKKYAYRDLQEQKANMGGVEEPNI